MSSNLKPLEEAPTRGWRMPVVPQDYDQRPPTPEEWQALEHLSQHRLHSIYDPRSRESRAARSLIARFDEPLADVFHLRHQGASEEMLRSVLRVMHCSMLRYGKSFWDWSEQEWLDIVCPNVSIFGATHGVSY